jgi:hypothetical protein
MQQHRELPAAPDEDRNSVKRDSSQMPTALAKLRTLSVVRRDIYIYIYIYIYRDISLPRELSCSLGFSEPSIAERASARTTYERAARSTRAHARIRRAGHVCAPTHACTPGQPGREAVGRNKL